MLDLITEAYRFQNFCLDHQWRFCFIGGLSVQHWGEPRLTRDIDVTVMVGFGTETVFVDAILESYQPRFEGAGAFALERRVLLVQSNAGIGIDISLGAIPFEEEMVRRAVAVEFAPGIELRLCSPEDLIVLKGFAARPQDWRDVASVVTRQSADNLDWEYIFSNLEPLALLKDQPGSVERLKQLRGSS